MVNPLSNVQDRSRISGTPCATAVLDTGKHLASVMATRSPWALFLAALAASACLSSLANVASAALAGDFSVSVDFGNVTRLSRTTTTLQVVSNPILDRTFTAPNGTQFANPIHDAAFASLAALEADTVRYGASG